MYNVVIWGTGEIYRQCFASLKLQELAGVVKVVAVMSNDIGAKPSIGDYSLISKEDISALDFDYCLVALDDMNTVLKETNQLGIAKDKLIAMRVFLLPHFDFNKYIFIKESRPTILSRNCWAGMCYHRLGLEFLSPTINMFFSGHDFNKFVANLDYYLSLPVELVEMRYQEILKWDYPICRLGEGDESIQLYFNHYNSFDYAKECWEKRKKRINYDKMLVISSTEAIEEAVEFENISYPGKMIFTSFQSDLKSSIYIPRDQQWASFGEQINLTVSANNDILELVYCLVQITE